MFNDLFCDVTVVRATEILKFALVHVWKSWRAVADCRCFQWLICGIFEPIYPEELCRVSQRNSVFDNIESVRQMKRY